MWRSIAAIYVNLPAVSCSAWAAEHRRLSSESSNKRGKWVSMPYQIEPMDAPSDPDVVEVVLQWASQTGKSEIINNLIGYYAHADPSPQLLVQPTIELAEAYSKDRIAPMIRDAPALRRIIKDARRRDSGNTITSKYYPGGSLVLIGSNAPSGLAGRPRRCIYLDEIDRYPTSAGEEGDPISLADKRAESFPNAIKVKTSTPTVKGFSKIEMLLEQSDYRKWHVFCPKCRNEHVLMWANVKFEWPDPEDAEKKIRDTKRTCIECPKCRAELNDENRVAMVRDGRWAATRPFNGVRGYWLNGLNTLFHAHKGYKNRLHQFAEEALKAKKKGREAIKTWVNTFLAETWEEEGETLTPNPLMARRETYGPKIPRHCLVLIGKADVQGDRIEAEIEGYGLGQESWGIRYTIIMGPPQLKEAWKQLDEFFLQTFEHENGATMKVSIALVDAGFEQDLVLQYTKPREGHRIYAVKGSSTAAAPIVARGTRNNQQHALMFPVGGNAAKDLIFGRLRLAEPGAGYCHWPTGFGYDDEFYYQLTAEKAVTRYHAGQPIRVYEKTRARNEALDLKVYGVAGLHILKPDLIALHKELNGDDAQTADDEREALPDARQVPQPPPPSGDPRKPISQRRKLGGYAVT